MVDRFETAYAKFNNICVVVAFLPALIVYCTDSGERKRERGKTLWCLDQYVYTNLPPPFLGFPHLLVDPSSPSSIF